MVNAIEAEYDSDDDEEFVKNHYSLRGSVLNSKILKNYNPEMRPLKNQSESLIVKTYIQIDHISIHQNQGTITAHGKLVMRFYDEFLVWDPEEFRGIDTTLLSNYQVYQPGFTLANKAKGIYSEAYMHDPVKIFVAHRDAHGLVIKLMRFTITASCVFDFSDYPYDENQCSLTFIAKSNMHEIQLKSLGKPTPEVSLGKSNNSFVIKKIVSGWGDFFHKNIVSEFEIKNLSKYDCYLSSNGVSTTFPNSSDLYKTTSMIGIKVTFGRHAPLFTAAILMPCFLTAALAILPWFITDIRLALVVLSTNTYVQVLMVQDMTDSLPFTVSKIPSSITLFKWLMIFNCLFMFLHVFYGFLLYKATSVCEWFSNTWMVNYVPVYLQKLDDKTDEKPRYFKLLLMVRPIFGCFVFVIYAILFFLYLIIRI